MAGTLSLTPAVHSAPSFIMPRVVVVPPEEDEEPAYCCFDANRPVERAEPTQSDIQFLDSALDILCKSSQSSAPAFHRSMAKSEDLVMPKRREDNRSIAEILTSEAEEEGEYDDDGDITIRGQAPGNDSEVIEVVKVRRYSEHYGRHTQEVAVGAQQPPPMKKSKTFISKALRSLKGVGKHSKHKQPYVNQVFAASTDSPISSFSPQRGSSSRASDVPLPSRSISKRSSIMLNQLFHSHSRTSLRRKASSSSLDTDDEDVSRVPSPTPSAQTFSTRRRFSVLNLFSSFSSTGSEDGALPMSSSDSLGPSSTSSSAESSLPVTPVDSQPPCDTDVTPTKLRRFSSFKLKTGKDQAPIAAPKIGEEGRGMEYEMHLDSLHFDELSFDVNRF